MALVAYLKVLLKRYSFVRKFARVAHLYVYRMKIIFLDAVLPLSCLVAKKVHMPWGGLFEARTRMLHRQMKKNLRPGSVNYSMYNKYAQKIIETAKYTLSLNPNFIFGMRVLASSYSVRGYIDESEQWMQNIFSFKKRWIQKNNLENLGLRFVDVSPLKQTIGVTAVYNAYLKATLLSRGPPIKLVMLLNEQGYKQFVNPHIMTYWEDYIDVIRDPNIIRALKPLAEIMTANDFEHLEVDGKAVAPQCALPWLQEDWDEQARPPLFVLTKEDVVRGKVQLKKLGIPDGAWFVCLHVREGGARFDEPFRQTDIYNYMKSIKAIVNRGGWVVRMGDNSMMPLPQMENVIDYPHTDYKSDFMDVFLCGSCKFFISTSSGLYAIAAMFGRPIVQTNLLPTCAVDLSKYDLFLPKLLKIRDDGALLKFDKLFSSPVNHGGTDYFFDNVINADPIDNTPEELEALVLEMMDRLDGTAIYTDEEEDLQKQFKDMTAEVETLPGLPGVPLNARMGQYYLNKHQRLLTGEEAPVALVED
ncbi:MAG: TIGR04372 family glycosyltransferase [Mariprofundaceae bacterium]|nr:TIGR04372 family glycosyltransferase [Mariprofundaceae bacterium]